MSGSRSVRSVSAWLGTAATLVAVPQDDANAMKDAASGSSTLSTISSVTATLASAQTQVTNAVDDLRSIGAKGDLEDAFSEAPNCSSVPGLS